MMAQECYIWIWEKLQVLYNTDLPLEQIDYL